MLTSCICTHINVHCSQPTILVFKWSTRVGTDSGLCPTSSSTANVAPVCNYGQLCAVFWVLVPGSRDTLCTLSQWHCWRPLYWALRGDGVRRGYMHCPTRYFEFRKPDVDPTFSAYFIYFSSILYLYSLQHHRYFILLIKYWKLNMMNNVKNDNIVLNF